MIPLCDPSPNASEATVEPIGVESDHSHEITAISDDAKITRDTRPAIADDTHAPAFVQRGSQLPETTASGLVPAGRLTEISGHRGTSAKTSVLVEAIRDAQEANEPCAWVLAEGTARPFAPDLVAAGVRLEDLALVEVPAREGALRAAELLLRSGGFGLVVVELPSALGRLAARGLARLRALAREHDARVCLMTEGEAPQSLGPMVGVRYVPRRTPAYHGAEVRLEVLRDKVGFEAPNLRFGLPADLERFDGESREKSNVVPLRRMA